MSKTVFRFQTFKSGHVGTGKKPEKLMPNGVQNNEDEEDVDYGGSSPSPDKVESKSGGTYMLPPAQNDHINKKDTSILTKNRPVAGEQEPLFPLGINPNDKDQ